MKNRELLYPIFLECSDMTDDNYWKVIFEQLAYGQTPHGVYISKNFLCCNYRKRSFSYKIEHERNVSEVYNEVYNLLKTNAGLISDEEKKDKTKKTERSKREDNYDSWNSVKKKHEKEQLIEMYISKVKNEHKLSIEQSKNLLSVINSGLIFKTITAKDIQFKNGHIDVIHGVSIEDGEIVLERDIYTRSNNNNHVQPEIHHMSDTWDKYIKMLEKMSLTKGNLPSVENMENDPEIEELDDE